MSFAIFTVIDLPRKGGLTPCETPLFLRYRQLEFKKHFTLELGKHFPVQKCRTGLWTNAGFSLESDICAEVFFSSLFLVTVSLSCFLKCNLGAIHILNNGSGENARALCNSEKLFENSQMKRSKRNEESA